MEGRRLYVKHPSYNNKFVDESNTLSHEGRSKDDGAPGPGSGRYPLGSGKRPFQHRDGVSNVLGKILAYKNKNQNSDSSKSSDDTRKYQYEDGTLTPLGKIHYKTGDNYKLMTDEQIKKLTQRKRIEKEYDDAKKNASFEYRVKSNLEDSIAKSLTDAASTSLGGALGKLLDKQLDKVLGANYKDPKTYEDAKKAFNAFRNIAAKSFKFTMQDPVHNNKEETPKADTKEPPKTSEEQKPVDVPNKKKNKKKNKNTEQRTEQPSKSESKSNNAETKSEPEKPLVNQKKSDMKELSEKTETKSEKPLMNQKKPAMKEIFTKKEEPKISVKRDSEEKKPEAPKISDAKKNAIRASKRSGRTIAEIAKSFGVSPSTVEEIIKGS